MKNKSEAVKRILTVLLILVLAGFVMLSIANLIVTNSVKSRIYNEPDITSSESFSEFQGEPIDCIIVPGCGVTQDGVPTPLLEDRLNTAVSLYKKGVAPKLLMSGDHGSDGYNEVAAMRRYALDNGVPSEDIFMDHAGFSTYETMYRAGSVFDVNTAVIVTQKYHLSRALYDARALGIDACGCIATGHVFAMQAYYSGREMLARAKDLIWCAFKPSPTYGGDQIDISGNGEVTLD